MNLNDLLKGNVLIGSRVINKARHNSDWDIVCTQDTADYVLKNGSIKDIEEYECGYEICNEKLGSNGDDIYEDCDQGGFGADLQSIIFIEFTNGLKINLFVYPNKKKFKLYKKLNREIKKISYEFTEKMDWVNYFIKLQYELGINKDLS